MRIFALAAVFGLTVACAVPMLPGDAGDSSADALTSGGSCSLARAKILSSAGGDRRAAIERGFAWLDANVQYSQTRRHDGYRTDCSGFLSMCWQLSESFTTTDLASGDAENSRLGSYDDLLPADGFVRRVNGSGHAILFLAWNDNAHREACVLEQESTAADMQFHVRATSSLTTQGYHAIRADRLPADSSTADTNDTTGETPAPSQQGNDDHDDDSSGIACVSDGTCNPGNNGSGRICVGGRCVPGCHSDAHCPGIQRCVSGQCQ